jgi:hypothetical protein
LKWDLKNIFTYCRKWHKFYHPSQPNKSSDISALKFIVVEVLFSTHKLHTTIMGETPLTNKLKPVTEAKEVAMEAPESASSPR